MLYPRLALSLPWPMAGLKITATNLPQPKCWDDWCEQTCLAFIQVVCQSFISLKKITESQGVCKVLNYPGVGYLDPFHKELKFFSGQAHRMTAQAPESTLDEALAHRDIPNMAFAASFLLSNHQFLF